MNHTENKLKILEGRTVEQALTYFKDGRTQFSNRVDPLMSEVYTLALEWKGNIRKDERNDYPIQDVCESIILGEI